MVKINAAYLFSGHLNGQFNWQEMFNHRLTHIILCFYFPDEDGRIVSTFTDEESLILEAIKSKAKQKGVNVLFCIGGIKHTPYLIKAMRDEQKFKNVVDSSLALLNDGFSGVVVDWEFPGFYWVSQRHEVVEDEVSLHSQFVQALRHGIDSLEYDVELAVAVHNIPCHGTNYDFDTLVECCDFFNVMTLEYSNPYIHFWGSDAWHHCPLYDNGESFICSENAMPAPMGSVESSVNYYLGMGVEENKIVISIPFYGRVFPFCKGIGLPFEKGVDAESIGYPDYVCTYKTIEEIRKNGNGVFCRDDEAEAPYVLTGDHLLSFDDEASILEKVKYVNERNLGGVATWSLPLDSEDFVFTKVIMNNLS